MPEPDYFIRVGDGSVVITDVLSDEDGDPVNISGATVEFHLAPIQGGAAIINASASNDQATAGTGHVSYTFGTTVPGTAGLYLGEWEVTYNGGGVQTFPNDRYILVRATEGVA